MPRGAWKQLGTNSVVVFSVVVGLCLYRSHTGDLCFWERLHWHTTSQTSSAFLRSVRSMVFFMWPGIWGRISSLDQLWDSWLEPNSVWGLFASFHAPDIDVTWGFRASFFASQTWSCSRKSRLYVWSMYRHASFRLSHQAELWGSA